MKTFLARHAQSISGVLSGFDRILFRGTLRQPAHVAGFMAYLAYKRVLLQDFGKYAERTSETIKRTSLEVAERLSRPIHHVDSGAVSKEDIALKILEQDPVKDGLICALTCVEPCQTFELGRCREQKKLILRSSLRKCLHIHHYFLHKDFGFLHARLQTWFPFTTQVCINGRRWPAHQMDLAGIKYHRRENCFPWVEDLTKAQQLLDQQLRVSWKRSRDKIADAIHPAHKQIFAGDIMDRYWSVREAEWATDVMFDSPSSLAPLYRSLVRHAITTFSSSDVMRFLGRKLNGNFSGEIVSDYKHRPEGIRVKHRINSNSLKIHDQQATILRVETTINNPRDIKVYRKKQNDPSAKRSWQPLRKGIADLHRLASVSQKSSERYLDALALVDTTTRVGEAIDTFSRPVVTKKGRFRARRWDENDTRLLQAVNRGEFTITGFRDRDISSLLYSTPPTSPEEVRRRRSRVTRLLRILREHKVICKIPRTHRHRMTSKARELVSGILAAREATLSSLINVA